MFVLIFIATIAFGVYANTFQEDKNFRPITIIVSSDNYTNCTYSNNHVYCDEVIIGQEKSTGKPYKWSALHVYRHSEIAPNSEKQYWTVSNDYSDMHDLDIRSGPPVAKGWPDKVFLVLIFASLATGLLLFFTMIF